MKATWFKNPDDRETIEQVVKFSPAFKRLRQILTDKLEDLMTKETLPETYRDQDWSHLQAHFNGRKQELFFILDLLDPGDE